MKSEYSVGEVAKLLNVARSTVVYWIKGGKLESYKLPGGHNRITREHFYDFLEKHDMPLSLMEEDSRKRILIVDDEEPILKILKRAFKKEPFFKIETTDSGYKAGVLTATFRPHLIILDIKLADVDGRKVCEELRDNQEFSETKIIAISGRITQKTEAGILKQGFDDYLGKPFEFEDLMEKVKKLLGIKR